MRKQTIAKALFALCSGAFITSACVNEDYDLSNLDKTVKIGNGSFTLPSSSTEEIKLDNLFDLAKGGAIQIKGDVYYLHTGGSANIKPIEIGSIQFDAPKIGGFQEQLDRTSLLPKSAPAHRAVAQKLPELPVDQIIENAKAIAKTLSYTYPFQNISLEFNNAKTGEVTEDITDIRRITFGNNQSVEFNISVSQSGRIKSANFESLSFVLPLGIEIDRAIFRGGDDEHLVTIKADGSDNRYSVDEKTGKQVFEFFKEDGNEPEKKFIFGDNNDKKASITLYVTGAYIGENTLFGWSKEKGKKGVVTMNKNDIQVLGEIKLRGDEDLDLTWALTPEETTQLISAETDADRASVFFPERITFKGAGEFNPGILSVATFSGSVQRTIDDIDDIELNDLPDFLTEDDVNLDLANPQLLLRIYSDLETDAVIRDVKLEASYNDGKNPIHIDLGDIVYHTPNGEYFAWITNDESQDIEWTNYEDFEDELDKYFEWYENIAVQPIEADLSYLLQDVPDNISISQGNQENLTIDLPNCENLKTNQTYNVEINYMINCPLAFGDNFEIVYRKSETGLNLGSDLDKIDVGQLTLQATATTTIPLDIILDVTPIDKQGNEIKDLKVDKLFLKNGEYIYPVTTDSKTGLNRNELTIHAMAGNGKPADNIAIVIRTDGKKTLNDYLKEGPNQLDGFKYSARLKNNEDESTESLKPDTYIKLSNVRISVNGGITIMDK